MFFTMKRSFSTKEKILAPIIVAIILGFIITPFREWVFTKFEFISKKYIYKHQYKIKYDRVGDIYLGMPIANLREICNKYDFNLQYDKAEHFSDVLPVIYITDEKDSLMMIIEKGFKENHITVINVFSSKFSTENGLHPTMTVTEYTKKYNSEYLYNSIDLVQYGEEYFKPFDFQTDSTEFRLVTSSMYYGGNFIGDNYLPLNVKLEYTDDFKNDAVAVITYISIF